MCAWQNCAGLGVGAHSFSVTSCSTIAACRVSQPRLYKIVLIWNDGIDITCRTVADEAACELHQLSKGYGAKATGAVKRSVKSGMCQLSGPQLRQS